MKKITLFALAALSLVLVSCNKEQIHPVLENGNTFTMTLNASVEQTKATIGSDWKFAFAEGDKISLTNNQTTDYYTVTCGSDGKFTGTVVAPESETTWFAYYPSKDVSLVGQSRTQTDAAAYYAYSGKQENVAAGSKNLDITLAPQTAILVITSKRAELDINVKTSDGKWVSGLAATEGAATFDVKKSDTKVTLLTTPEIGTYYAVVPAGVQIAIYDGDTKVKETKTDGLVAGKYYNITIEARTIADVLATVDGGFPVGENKTTAPSDAWAYEVDRVVYTFGTKLFFLYNRKTHSVGLSNPVTAGVNCYTYTLDAVTGYTITFNMENGKLISIVAVFNFQEQQQTFGGTYEAPFLE